MPIYSELKDIKNNIKKRDLLPSADQLIKLVDHVCTQCFGEAEFFLIQKTFVKVLRHLPAELQGPIMEAAAERFEFVDGSVVIGDKLIILNHQSPQCLERIKSVLMAENSEIKRVKIYENNTELPAWVVMHWLSQQPANTAELIEMVYCKMQEGELCSISKAQFKICFPIYANHCLDDGAFQPKGSKNVPVDLQQVSVAAYQLFLEVSQELSDGKCVNEERLFEACRFADEAGAIGLEEIDRETLEIRALSEISKLDFSQNKTQYALGLYSKVGPLFFILRTHLERHFGLYLMQKEHTPKQLNNITAELQKVGMTKLIVERSNFSDRNWKILCSHAFWTCLQADRSQITAQQLNDFLEACPKLRSLRLAHCRKLTDWMKKLPNKQYPNLQELDLSMILLSQEDLETLLRTFPNLTSLHVRGKNLDFSSAPLSKLNFLEVDCYQSQPPAGLETLSKLRELRVVQANIAMEDQFCEKTLPDSLRILDLSDCSCKLTAWSISKLMVKKIKIEFCELKTLPHLNEMTFLTTVSFDETNCSDTNDLLTSQVPNLKKQSFKRYRQGYSRFNFIPQPPASHPVRSARRPVGTEVQGIFAKLEAIFSRIPTKLRVLVTRHPTTCGTITGLALAIIGLIVGGWRYGYDYRWLRKIDLFGTHRH